MRKKGARLGQHFLNNPHYAELLARESGCTHDDVVLEIGPGEGMLTKELIKVSKKVIAVEKDELLVQKLHLTFASEIHSGKLEIISADVRNITPEALGLRDNEYVLAANIPYYITGELLRKFLESDSQPRTIAFLMQKEVADRILSSKESILSISIKVYGTPRVAARVSRGNFTPPPSVDSAILIINKISKNNFSHFSEEYFFTILRAGFSSKRKLLTGNLSSLFPKERILEVFAALSINVKSRAEDLNTGQWISLTKALVSTDSNPSL
jgi:16S rRNA (adenine1518-N6/adenine1519-N6)-dimethyltransferase